MYEQIKAMLFGFMYGDGWISAHKNGNYICYMSGFSGDSESLEIVKQDLKEIYGHIGTAKINTRNTVSEKYNINGITSSFATTINIAKDFIKLGMPTGKKVETEFIIPDWIVNGDNNIKAAFISGLYAAEGYMPATQKNDKTLKVLGFNITKRKNLEDNFMIFLQQISQILNDIGISHQYKIIETETCDTNLKAIITFDNSLENILRVTSILDIRYNIPKQIEFRYVQKYYQNKQKVLTMLRLAKEEALQYNCSAQAIANKYGITRSQVEKWRNRKTDVRIPNSFPTYSAFKTCCPL